MAVATIYKEGAFDADVRNATNSNFSVLRGVVAGTQALTGLSLSVSAKSGSTDAISPTVAAVYAVTTAGVNAMTLTAPSTDGLVIIVNSETANAHTITATSLFATGGAGSPYTTATFAAKKGAGVVLMSLNGLWAVLASGGVTFS